MILYLIQNQIKDQKEHQPKVLCRQQRYSKGMVPRTLEGKVLQDADRLDALGAIGIARTFAVGGAEKRPFYNKDDPFCHKRSPNDQEWALDHFYKKLLLLEKKMNTKTAKKEAANVLA